MQSVLQHTGLQTKKVSEWNDDDLYNFAKELRKITKPILIAANKADLCKDLSIIIKW